MRPEILLITGAAGVGKSTVSWEVCEELQRRGLPHAAIDTDELDRVWPLALDDPRRHELNVANLRAWWEGCGRLGVTRIVLAGVFVDLVGARTWISEAIAPVAIAAVRLTVSDDELSRRVARREIGTGGEAQLRRSRLQAAAIAGQPANGAVVISTDGVAVEELARRLCDLVGWFATTV